MYLSTKLRGMYTYDIFIYNDKDLETYSKRGKLKPEVLLVLTGERKSKSRMTAHLDNPKEIILVVRLTADCGAQSEKLPRKIFLRKACAEYHLNPAECNVMMQLIETSDNEVIAGKIFISAHTVASHRKKIFRKLAVHSYDGAVRKILSRAAELMKNKYTG